MQPSLVVRFEARRPPPVRLFIIMWTPLASIVNVATDRPQVRWDVHVLIMELNKVIIHFGSRAQAWTRGEWNDSERVTNPMPGCSTVLRVRQFMGA
jgi:hypothetical protein